MNSAEAILTELLKTDRSDLLEIEEEQGKKYPMLMDLITKRISEIEQTDRQRITELERN